MLPLMEPEMAPQPSEPENEVKVSTPLLTVPEKLMDTVPQELFVPDTEPAKVEPSLLMASVMVPDRALPAENVPVQYPA